MPFQEITRIGLPNGQQYSFIYDPTTTLLQRVTYPSGGYIRYVWQLVQQSSYNVYTGKNVSLPGPNCEEIYATYALQNRYVSFNGTTEALEQDFSYTSNWTTNGWEYWTNKQTTVITKDNVRGTSYATVYSYTPFYQPAQPNDLSVVEPVGFPVESQIAYYSDATENTLLKTVTKMYSDPALPPTETDTLDDAASHPTSETNPVYSCIGGKVSNICRLAVFTDEYNYDYGSGAPGALLKHTHIDYATFAPTPLFPSEASILDRPSDVIICQTATCNTSNEIAETDYIYDGQAVSGVSSATEHDETNYSTDLPPAFVHVRIRQVSVTPSPVRAGIEEREGKGTAFESLSSRTAV